MNNSQYELIATLGPVSDEPKLWHSMLDKGVDGFRLNTSHMSLPELEAWLNKFRVFQYEAKPPVYLVLDLQGSKWRLGDIIDSELVQGEQVRLVNSDKSGQRDVLPVPHPDFFSAAPMSSSEVYLNDAKVHLKIVAIDTGGLKAAVIRGGLISSGKGITFAQSEFRQEVFSQKDVSIIRSTKKLPNIRYAISYVKDAKEMELYKSRFHASAYLIAKVERRTAVDDFANLAHQSSEVWVCRGDLGAELGMPGMAMAVHEISQKVAGMPVPVFLAGQVLEHMTALPVPTRSEMCYMFDCLTKGYRGFVLSDETAAGRFPLKSCEAASAFKAPS